MEGKANALASRSLEAECQLHGSGGIWELGTDVWVGCRPPTDLDAFGRSDSEGSGSKMQIMDAFLWGRCLTEDEIAIFHAATSPADYDLIDLPEDGWRWWDSPSRVCLILLLFHVFLIASVKKR